MSPSGTRQPGKYPFFACLFFFFFILLKYLESREQYWAGNVSIMIKLESLYPYLGITSWKELCCEFGTAHGRGRQFLSVLPWLVLWMELLPRLIGDGPLLHVRLYTCIFSPSTLVVFGPHKWENFWLWAQEPCVMLGTDTHKVSTLFCPIPPTFLQWIYLKRCFPSNTDNGLHGLVFKEIFALGLLDDGQTLNIK